MANLHLILYVFAFVLFVAAAFGVPSPRRLSWGWLGLACWVLTLIV